MPGQGQGLPNSFKFEQFGGMLPAWDDTLIPPGQASDAENAYLYTGGLAGWRKPKLLYTLQGSASKFAYRLPTLTETRAQAIFYMLLQPINAVQVTVGEETYTFVAGTPAAAYQVAIGATLNDSLANFFNALTLDSGANTGAGTIYGVGTYANPAIDQSGPPTLNQIAYDVPRIHVFAPEVGAAYNVTKVSHNAPGYFSWRKTDTVTETTTLAGGVNLTFDPDVTSPSTWMEFADPDTDVIRSPVVDDEHDRYYFASPSLPPKYNPRDRIEAGSPAWLLGVPAPNCSPEVTVSGGGDAVVLAYDATNISGASATLLANVIYLLPVTPEGNTVLTDMVLLAGADMTDVSYAAVLYDDNNGVPNTLLNVGVLNTSDVANGDTLSSAFLNPTGLLANSKYWIGMMFDKAMTVQVADATGTPAYSGYTVSNTFSNGPPATITSYNTGQPTLVIYGNGTSDDVLSARSYVYTYVTEYGEESAPSPATVETGWSNGVWTINLFTPPPDQMGVTRNITKTKLYRSITSLAGATTYFFITELPVATATYEDINSDDEIVVNDQLISQLWTPPPEGLLGFVSMPNGIIAGWRANEIWFCEPYRPHAWPAAYVLTTEYPIVGLGVSGSSVVACTAGAPYVANGVQPGLMSTTKVQNSEPCMSRGSILGVDEGVYYASPNGLILVTQYGAVKNSTGAWITREKWQQLTPQKNLRAVLCAGGYLALGCVRDGDASVAQTGFTLELTGSTQDSAAPGLEPSRHRVGFNRLTAPNGYDVDNLRLDPWSAVALVIQNGGVWYYDFSDTAPEMQVYTWRSKKFQQRSKENFAAMRFKFSIPDGTPALNATRLEADTDDPVWVSGLPADRYGFLRVYAGNNELVTTREIRRPMEILRLSSGFKHETWVIEIEARVPIANFQIATSPKALAQT